MTLRKAVFTVTAGSGAQPVNNQKQVNQGSTDVHLRSSVRDRGARIESVLVDVSAAQAKNVDVCLSEVDTSPTVASDETTAETTTLGRQVFYVDLATGAAAEALYPFEDVYMFDSRHPVVTSIGTVPTTDQYGARELIQSSDVRCEVFKMAPSDVVTVTMYYETAGDYRF